MSAYSAALRAFGLGVILVAGWSAGIAGAEEAKAPGIDCPSGTALVHGDAEEGFKGEWCERAGVRQGPYREFYPSGKTRVEAAFRAGKKHGSYVVWSDKGVKIREGEYEDGAMAGEWTRWYPNGKLSDRGEWLGEKPHGSWTLWYENGQLKAEGEFEEGIRVGSWTFWREDGSLKEGGSFEAGKEICEWTQWDAQGNETQVMKGEPAAGCSRMFLNRARVSWLAVLQTGGGRSFSALALWAPAYRLSGVLELRGGFGGTMLVGAAGGERFLALQASLMLGWAPGRLELELGGGAQVWVDAGGAGPMVGGNVIYRFEKPLLGLVQRAVIGSVGHFLTDPETHEVITSQQLTLGAEIQF